MAKLADALASGASGRKVVQVQVLFRALETSNTTFAGHAKVLKGEEIFQHFFCLYDILTCVEQSHIHYSIGGFCHEQRTIFDEA